MFGKFLHGDHIISDWMLWWTTKIERSRNIMNNSVVQVVEFGNLYSAMSQATLPCTPPPKKKWRGWAHYFRIGVKCSQKNVPKGKPVLFGGIQVKRHKNVVWENIHSNQILKELTLFDDNE